jgi:hypothetical protein
VPSSFTRISASSLLCKVHSGKLNTLSEKAELENAGEKETSMVKRYRWLFAGCLAIVFAGSRMSFGPLQCFGMQAASAVLPSGAVIGKSPTWRPPQVADVKAQVTTWALKYVPDSAQRSKALAVISGASDQATGSELLDRLAATLALVDPRVAQLVEVCGRPRSRAVLPTFPWLTDAKTDPLVAANMRLYFGRWLVQGQWNEEALEQIGTLTTAEVVAPAELLFYQGVIYHRMLNKEEGLKVIRQLLDGAEASPRRYIAVAFLMQADLASLEEGSLDEIARRMKIIEKQLDQGRAGPKVRKVERDVIELLDKLIKELEEPPCGPRVPGPPPRKPGYPAKDSVPIPYKAPGSVKKQDLLYKSGWGDLPPKEREEALQQMGRDFPPHYRDAIEEYFRKLAAEEASDDDDK